MIHPIREADDSEGSLDVLAALGFRELGQQQRQLDVLKRSEHGNQVVHLENESDMARAPLGELAAGHVRDLVAGDGNAAFRGHVQAAEEIEQRSLAGAAGAHEGDELALVHVEIQTLQNMNYFAAAAVGLIEPADLNQTACVSCAVHSNHFGGSYFLISTASPS